MGGPRRFRGSTGPLGAIRIPQVSYPRSGIRLRLAVPPLRGGKVPADRRSGGKGDSSPLPGSAGTPPNAHFVRRTEKQGPDITIPEEGNRSRPPP